MKTIIDFKTFKNERELENYIDNSNLTDVEILNLEKVGDGFLYYNKKLKNFRAPNLKEVGLYFLYNNTNLENLIVPNLKILGDLFLYCNKNLNIYNIKTKIYTHAKKDTIVFKKMRTGEVIQFLLKKGTKLQIHDVKARGEYLFAIEDVDYKSFYNQKFDKKYKKGDKIEPDYFDEKYLTCSSGIHFFFNKEDATNYAS